MCFFFTLLNKWFLYFYIKISCINYFDYWNPRLIDEFVNNFYYIDGYRGQYLAIWLSTLISWFSTDFT